MSLLDTTFDLEQFTQQLNNELNNSLPGFDAQKIMSPSIREHALKKVILRSPETVAFYYSSILKMVNCTFLLSKELQEIQVIVVKLVYQEESTKRAIPTEPLLQFAKPTKNLGLNAKKLKYWGS